MATIADHFAQAQLSLAAYALDLDPGMSGTSQIQAYRDKLETAGMSAKQAEEFAKQYTVVAQSPESGFLRSKKGDRFIFSSPSPLPLS